MKTPYKNIYTVLKINRWVTLITVSGALCSSLFSGYIVYTMYRTALNSAFVVNTNGAVIPLTIVAQKDNFEAEALGHLDLFHTYFYNIDASNYEKNLEKALWLGNSSVDNLYRQKKAEGVYNRLLQFSLVQKVLQIDSQIQEQEDSYSFTTTTIFEINRGIVVDRYELMQKSIIVCKFVCNKL